jgi:hypothetical protein
MRLTALLWQRQSRRCSAASRWVAPHTVTMVRIVARPCERCMLLSASRLPCKVFRSRRSCSAWYQLLTHLVAWSLLYAGLRSIPTLHLFLAHLPSCLFVSSLTSSRLPASGIRVLGNHYLHWRNKRETNKSRLRRVDPAVICHVDLCRNSQRAGCCARNGTAVISRRRANLVQLSLYHTRSAAGVIGECSCDDAAYLCA